MMSERLVNEVEIFFAEVEAMKDSHATDDNVPKTNWIVQVDPKTNTPYYCNYVTKETTWDIPDEYQAYLTKYERYLKNQQEETTKPQENKEKAKSPTPKQIFPEGNARKRRRIKRAFMRSNADKEKNSTNDGPIEFLSEYISYCSSSSSSQSISDSESGETQKSPLIEEHVEEKMDTEQNESQAFIGPQLPSLKPIGSDSFLEFTNPEKLSPHSSRLANINRSTLLEASQLLIEKFTAIDTQLDKFSPLQVAYVQFATRYEDWKYGYLPNERYFEKLEEVNDFLLQYEKTSLPQGSTWDPENKRYTCKSDERDGNGFEFFHDQTGVNEQEDARNQV
nr:WW Rsp5 WWP [Hymenolepis microstoma]